MPAEFTVNLNAAPDWVDLLSLVISAAVTISALFIGAWISRRSERESHARQFLAEAFADALARYCLWLDTQSSHEVALLYAAAEKARLLCSPETAQLLQELERKVASRSSPEECAKTVTQLRRAMQSELELAQKHKRHL